MPLLRPDPTFYPSPRMATQSPPESHAYVALINSTRNGGTDAIGVVDVDPDSRTYGRLVGQTDMPHQGDELHQCDVSDPFRPRKVSSIRLGGIVARAEHPSRPGEALNGGPQMVEISRDGKRIYFTNALYTPWDEQYSGAVALTPPPCVATHALKQQARDSRFDSE